MVYTTQLNSFFLPFLTTQHNTHSIMRLGFVNHARRLLIPHSASPKFYYLLCAALQFLLVLRQNAAWTAQGGPEIAAAGPFYVKTASNLASIHGEGNAEDPDHRGECI